MLDPEQDAARMALECLEGGEVTYASKMIANGLKRNPNSQSMRTLDALALVLQRRRCEALERTKRLCGPDAPPLSEPVAMDAMPQLLMLLDMPETLVKMYEDSLNTLPLNKTLLEGMCAAYLTVGNYPGMQQTAMSLVKVNPLEAPRYWAWVAFTNSQQADVLNHSKTSGSEAKSIMFLKMASQMLDKFVLIPSDHPNCRESYGLGNAQLYLSVLQRQGEHQAAVDFICSERGTRLGTIEDRLRCLADCYGDEAKHPSSSVFHQKVRNGLAKHMWSRLNSDNWDTILLYLDTLSWNQSSQDEAIPSLPHFSLEVQPNSTLSKDAEPRSFISLDPDASLEDALQLARRLKAEEMVNRPQKMRRGPFLAEMEILKRQRQACQATSNSPIQGALEECLVAYAERFSGKPVCYLDLLLYLPLAPKAATVLATKYAPWYTGQHTVEGHPLGDMGMANEDRTASVFPFEALDSSEIEVAKSFFETQSLEDHYRTILGLKCGFQQYPLEAPRQNAEVQRLMQLCWIAYEAAAPYSASLAVSEEGLCDGYLLVAMNAAIRQFVAGGRRTAAWIFSGLSCISKADRVQSNPMWLILQVGMAQCVGYCAVEALRSLDLKSVQLDSMDHIGFWPLVTGGRTDEMESWIKDASRHFHDAAASFPSLRIKVLRHLSWPSFSDLTKFERKLKASLSRLENKLFGQLVDLRGCQTMRSMKECLKDNLMDLQEALSRSQVQLSSKSVVEKDTEGIGSTQDLLVAKSGLCCPSDSSESDILIGTLFPQSSAISARIERLHVMSTLLLVLRDVLMTLVPAASTTHVKKKLGKKDKKVQLPAEPDDEERRAAVWTPAVPNCQLEAIVRHQEEQVDGQGPLQPAWQSAYAVQLRWLAAWRLMSACESFTGENMVLPTADEFEAAIQQAFADASVFPWFFPEGFLLLSALQVASALHQTAAGDTEVPPAIRMTTPNSHRFAAQLPIRAWAAATHNILQKCVSNVAKGCEFPEAFKELAVWHKSKLQYLRRSIDDMMLECQAMGRR